MNNQEHLRNLRAHEGDEESSREELIVRNYFKNLDIIPDELNGKKILDIGSGANLDFAKYLSEHHIAGEVVSVDPAALESSAGIKGVRAFGEKLPFKNESFDVVVSNNSVPSIYYNYPSSMEMKKRIEESLQEMLRTVKGGGEIRFYPVYRGGDGTLFETTFEHLESLLEKLRRSGEYDISVIEKEKVRMSNIKLTALLIKIKKR